MSVVRLVKGRIREHRGKREMRDLLAGGAAQEISRADWPRSLSDPTSFYEDCVRYFYARLPEKFRAHREYFTEEFRGFGEDAFHVMWYLLFGEFKPRNFVEIGVYRGQTLSLAALLQKEFGCEGKLLGISPFTPAGDSVSKYLKSVDYLGDTLQNFAHFGLPKPMLLKAFSTDSSAKEQLATGPWDCAYIDGNHDYEIALQDWNACVQGVVPGGLIVLDDSGLSTSYRPPSFATGGHPGPSRLAEEIKRSPQFREIMQVGHNRVFQKEPVK